MPSQQWDDFWIAKWSFSSLPHSLTYQVTNGCEDKKNEHRFKKGWVKLTKHFSSDSCVWWEMSSLPLLHITMMTREPQFADCSSVLFNYWVIFLLQINMQNYHIWQLSLALLLNVVINDSSNIAGLHLIPSHFDAYPVYFLNGANDAREWKVVACLLMLLSSYNFSDVSVIIPTFLWLRRYFDWMDVLIKKGVWLDTMEMDWQSQKWSFKVEQKKTKHQIAQQEEVILPRQWRSRHFIP